MLFNNLKVLLAERNIKISAMSADTGISRTTLTALANNYSSGIQFDTLNGICNYLKVTPADFFMYLPYDYSLYISGHREHFTCDFTIKSAQKAEQVCFLAIDAYIDSGGVEIIVSLPIEDGDEEISRDNAAFKKFFNSLTPLIKHMIDERIINDVLDILEAECPASVEWDLD